MDEKKLTDEDIVKALKERKSVIDGEFERTGTPINFMMVAVDAVVVEETLDLIHRLQGENKRLTEENAIIKGNPPMCVGRSNGKTIRAKLLDYDRLKKQHDELCKENPNIAIIIEASESKYGELYDEAKGILREEAVKDTAIKCLTDIEDCINGMLDGERYMTKNEVEYLLEHILNKKQEYGVEVE